MGETLYKKVLDLHTVRRFASGEIQVLIGLHLVHEVTSPQAFQDLRERGLKVRFPNRTFATVDHIVPTDNLRRPFYDRLSEEMIAELERNVREFGIPFFSLDSGRQGIVHVIGPELGLTQPGMTIACGDSHTSTHGAFGAIAFGVGTSEVRDILATQTLLLTPLKVRRIEVSGRLGFGVTAKDLILSIISRLGVNGGVGYVYEYAGEVFSRLNQEERMTVCNMSIEGGARIGYVNPDTTTREYLRGRPFVPSGREWEEAVRFWDSIRSDPDAEYDDLVIFQGEEIEPMITWGINPGQAISVYGTIPDPASFTRPEERDSAEQALKHMGFKPGQKILGTPIEVAFLGSCTNARITDLRMAAKIVKGHKVKKGVKALVVPGSQQVARQAEEEGLREIFESAGFEWRGAGCSLCLGMNPDKLQGDEICASSSNRNFIGRQGSPRGRTLLMSPIMVAACAIAGEVVDVREFLRSHPTPEVH